MASDGDTSGLRRVFELAMAALRAHFAPAVALDQLDRVTNLGHGPILARTAPDAFLDMELAQKPTANCHGDEAADSSGWEYSGAAGTDRSA